MSGEYSVLIYRFALAHERETINPEGVLLLDRADQHKGCPVKWRVPAGLLANVQSSLVQRIVVASSDKAYGEAKELPYRETHPLCGRHPYDVSKSCTDLIAATYHSTYKLPVTIARCGNVYGGGDLNWSRIVPGTIRSLLRRERPVLRSDGTYVD